MHPNKHNYILFTHHSHVIRFITCKKKIRVTYWRSNMHKVYPSIHTTLWHTNLLWHDKWQIHTSYVTTFHYIHKYITSLIASCYWTKRQMANAMKILTQGDVSSNPSIKVLHGMVKDFNNWWVFNSDKLGSKRKSWGEPLL